MAEHPWTCMSHEEQVRRIEGLAAAALPRFGLPSECPSTLIRHGENFVFRIDAGDSQSYVLRIHRPGYQNEATIRSELQWTRALRDTGLFTPEPVFGVDGRACQSVGANEVPEPRTCVMFRWIEGITLDQSGTVEVFRLLGQLMAQIHQHGRAWSRPADFVRHGWDEEALLGENPLWGSFNDLTEWSAETQEMLLEARAVVRDRLQRLDKSVDLFGLIHGDLGPTNILVHDGQPHVLDFDDCGSGWYVYDLATTLWPYEDDPQFDAFQAALLQGYQELAHCPDGYYDELPALIMVRRLVCLGWTHSRRDSAHAKAHVATRIENTPRLVESFLESNA